MGIDPITIGAAIKAAAVATAKAAAAKLPEGVTAAAAKTGGVVTGGIPGGAPTLPGFTHVAPLEITAPTLAPVGAPGPGTAAGGTIKGGTAGAELTAKAGIASATGTGAKEIAQAQKTREAALRAGARPGEVGPQVGERLPTGTVAPSAARPTPIDTTPRTPPTAGAATPSPSRPVPSRLPAGGIPGAAPQPVDVGQTNLAKPRTQTLAGAGREAKRLAGDVITPGTVGLGLSGAGTLLASRGAPDVGPLPTPGRGESASSLAARRAEEERRRGVGSRSTILTSPLGVQGPANIARTRAGSRRAVNTLLGQSSA